MGRDAPSAGLTREGPAAVHPVLERLSGRWCNALALCLFAGAVVSVFTFINRYAVNILYSDQWSDVNLIRHAFDGSLSLGSLWTQHNENRILVPDLVVLVLGYTTHLQVRIEDFLSGIALCGTVALVILAHRRRSPSVPLIAYVPVAALLTSFVVTSDALYGFNLSWFLVLVALAGTIYLVDRRVLTWPWLAAAAVVALVGSLSSVQGLLIWPAVLVLLWLRRRTGVQVAAWVGAAVATGVVYFVRFDFARTGVGSSPSAGLASLVRYAVSEVGNVIGGQVTRDGNLMLGVLVIIVACAALTLGVRRGDDGGSVGVALMCFGGAFAASAAVGRSQLGLTSAVRFAPFVLLMWAGTYLLLLSVVVRGRPDDGATADGSGGLRKRAQPHAVVAARVLLVIVLAMAVFQVAASDRQGIDSARGWHSEELAIANVEANIDTAPDLLVASELASYSSAGIRQLAEFARAHRLSLYGTPLAVTEHRAGLDPGLLVRVVRPLSRQRLSGRYAVDAVITVPRPHGVVFSVSGHGLEDHQVAVGVRWPYGYLGVWDTRGVPDGTYQLRCRATGADARTTISPPVVVVVQNR